jgi:hypothetical protein
MQKDNPLMRKTLKTLLAVLLAVFSFSAAGEAATTTHPNRHHPRHANHTTTGSSATKKKAAHGKKTAKGHTSRTSPRHAPKHA